MKKWQYLLSFFIFLPLIIPLTIALQITEVMYVPSDGNEWVEIYNNDSSTFNLAPLQLKDATSTDTIECCQANCTLSIPSESFALIVDKDSSHLLLLSNYSQIFCVDDNSIGNGLSDTADSITLQIGQPNNLTILDAMSYGQEILANRNFTLERTLQDDFTQGFDRGGTPLMSNSVWDLTRAYRGLTISEILADPVGSDTAQLPQGEWIEVYNGADHEIDLRDITLSDQSGNFLLITSTNTFGSGVIICSGCYSVIYRNADIHFSLSNTEDAVTLSIEDQVINAFTYPDTTTGLSWSKVTILDDLNNSITDWVEQIPTPKEPNIVINNCDYALTLLTPVIIEDPDNYTFEIDITHLSGTQANINASGFIGTPEGDIIEEFIILEDELVSNFSASEYSPSLDGGLYLINLTMNPGCMDTYPENNNIQQLISVPIIDDVGEDVGDFEYWDIVNIEPVPVNAGDIVNVRVVGNVQDVSRFWMWVQDEKGKLTKESDFTVEAGTFDITLPFVLKDVCDRGGPTFIVMEGRGTNLQTEFIVSPIECPPTTTSKKSTASSKSSSNSGSYSLKEKIVQGLQVPSSVESQSTFETTLTFDAPKGEYDLWAYVYRGSACYSCAQKSIKPDERTYPLSSPGKTAIKTSIPITLDNLEPGEYQVKVKVLKKGNKTPREFHAPIHVTSSTSKTKTSQETFTAASNSSTTSSPQSSSRNTIDTTTIGPGIIMYQKDNSTPSEVITLFLALTFAVFLAAIIFSKSS